MPSHAPIRGIAPVSCALLMFVAGCGGASSVVPGGGYFGIPGSGTLDQLDDSGWSGGNATGSVLLENPFAYAAPASSAPCEAIGIPVDTTHEAMFNALNTYRTNNRLPALAYSKRLEAAADAHALDMYRRRFFAHVNPDGEGPGERALRAGFCHSYVGENIAEGDGLPTVAQAQAGWAASPGHNANMLHEPYRLVGMGHYYDPVTGYHYLVQDLALPNE
jgi:uncharacterized protein YkwD